MELGQEWDGLGFLAGLGSSNGFLRCDGERIYKSLQTHDCLQIIWRGVGLLDLA